jgi:hypothetical protein
MRCTPSVSIYLQGDGANWYLYAACSGGPDTVTVDHSGGFTSVNGVSFSDVNFNAIYITGAPGGLTANIHATVKPVHVEGHHNPDTVNIGDLSNKVQGIQAPVYVTNPPYYDIVNVNNQGDGIARTATINTATIGGDLYERITGLGMGGSAEIDCKAADTKAINLRTGSGGTTTSVLATASLPLGGATTIYGNHGNDTVNVGSAGSVQNIAGPLTIENDPDYTTINVYDYADGGNRTVTLENFTPWEIRSSAESAIWLRRRSRSSALMSGTSTSTQAAAPSLSMRSAPLPLWARLLCSATRTTPPSTWATPAAFRISAATSPFRTRRLTPR